MPAVACECGVYLPSLTPNASVAPNVTWAAINAKLLLGFPCKDGSFPVGGQNLNNCDASQFAAVAAGIGGGTPYPLAGVFEWTAATMTPAELVAWNAGMRAVLG